MSSSDDDDWFSKDLDDFVVSVPTIESNEYPERIAPKQTFQYDSDDVGGSYNVNRNLKQHKVNITNRGSTLKRYQHLLDQSSLSIFLEVINDISVLTNSIQDENLFVEVTKLKLEILERIIKNVPMPVYIQDLIDDIGQNASFFENIIFFWGAFGKKSDWKTLKEFAYLICNLVEIMLKQRANFKAEHFLNELIQAITQMPKTCSNNLNEEKNAFTHLLEKFHSSEPSKISTRSIYPSITELKTQPPFLEANIIDDRYANVQHYLNIHMALLREDYIGTIREGWQLFLKQYKTESFDSVSIETSSSTLKFYSNVWIKFERNNVNYDCSIQFDKTNFDLNTIFQNSSFKYGSLFVFTSSANLDDLVLATVSTDNKNSSWLRNGIPARIVYFENINKIFDQLMIMTEVDVFFESYHNVYDGLSSMDEHIFPFKKYVINLENKHNFPSYLLSRECGYHYQRNGFKLDLRNTDNWPPSNNLSVNEQQLNALKLSLTNELSIIQGPPGTGKTYMGLQILDTLFTNTNHTILILSYTNHALDQFIKGILQLDSIPTTNIVRLGRQSKESSLDELNLSQLQHNIDLDDSHYNIIEDQSDFDLSTYPSQSNRISTNQIKRCYYKLLQERKSLNNNISTEEFNISHVKRLQVFYQKLNELRQISAFNLIRAKRIVAMTTTRAANSHTLLNLIKPDIVIIEEAAETLESHIIASLPVDTKHLIMIGDHQQLRPRTSLFEMSRNYNLNISLFERMIKNKFNYITLSVQHRMRPAISNILRNTIYPQLSDHPSVEMRPDIRGVKHNVYFFAHTSPEEPAKSPSNKCEADMVLKLGAFLLKHGYSQDIITILTFYNGQVDCIKKMQHRKKLCNEPRIEVTTVDSFQGKENHIILLSLVRSNSNMGHVGTKNRIAVALSRARDGLFIFGNVDILTKNPTWKQIIQFLNEGNSVGKELNSIFI